MYSVMITGVLFLSQAMLVIKPIIAIGSLMCDGGSSGHCGI